MADVVSTSRIAPASADGAKIVDDRSCSVVGTVMPYDASTGDVCSIRVSMTVDVAMSGSSGRFDVRSDDAELSKALETLSLMVDESRLSVVEVSAVDCLRIRVGVIAVVDAMDVETTSVSIGIDV